MTTQHTPTPRQMQLARIAELESALAGIWDYACTGASLSDVNTYEQPQFVAARAALAKVQG